LLIAGWVIGVGDECIGAHAAAGMPEVLVSVFRRPDVEDAFPALRSTTKGMLAVIKPGEADKFTLFGFTVQLPPRRDNDTTCDALLAEHRERMGFLLRSLPDDSSERFRGLRRRFRPRQTPTSARAAFSSRREAFRTMEAW
jgi:hypothetical protein